MEVQIQPRTSQNVNLGRTERMLSLLTGLGMMSLMLMRRSKTSLPLGLSAAYMTYRGATGHCLAYQAMGINRLEHDGIEGIYIDRSITVNRPREELYRIWHNFENLPRFMKHLESVTVHNTENPKYSHWVTKGPMGSQVEWDSEVVEDHVNELLAWRSTPDSAIQSSGRVEFKDAPGGRGTVVHVTMHYQPPGGSMGAAVARLFGEEGGQQVRDDLRAFKQIMETGEIATTAGQPTGGHVQLSESDSTRSRRKKDKVEMASEDSFPASDAPGWISNEDS